MIMDMARRDEDDDDYESPDRFSAISPTRCTELLSSQSVGRVAWLSTHGLQILPVAYAYYEGTIVFRTSPTSVLSDLSDLSEVVFEIDEIDQRGHQGWSVVAHGQAQAVAEPREVSRLLTEAGVVPWAPGNRNLLIQITPAKVTGRTVSAR
jgi:nitroimidazol reductase NimA-like FMN-containing flavoprotein (pyridoxamine 5'-phosphate oxidase superfamily)